MAYSQIVVPGDGVTTQFIMNFEMGYLKQADVTCRVGDEVDGLGDPVYRTLTWIDESTVQVGGTVPAVGQNVVFTRTVDKSALIHDYNNGAALVEVNLDESFKQAMMAMQEIADGRFGTYQQDLDMGNFNIRNVANGTLPGDAVNKSQLDAVSIGSGNVPIPGVSDIGKFLKATATSIFAWTALAYSDISTLITANIATIAAQVSTSLGLGTAATKNVGVSANNVPQLNGSAQMPAVSAVNMTNTGRLLRTTMLTASGTYSKPTDASYIIVYVYGGGGGGGGAKGLATFTTAAAAGGGGGLAVKKILVSALAASETVTIGAGGTAGATTPTDGGDGGSSSFGAWAVSTGGKGGKFTNAAAVGTNTGAGGVGTTGDILLPGGAGGKTIYTSSSNHSNMLGGGTPGKYGQNGSITIESINAAVNGVAALANSGSGGTGGITQYNTAASTATGGAGGAGYIVVEEYA